ncbi:MAG: integrin alpha, partial [Cyanobacteria bacterium J06633_2]
MAFPAQFDLSDLNGTNGFAINGINVDEESGFSVSNAGDVNGDNIDDVIIGAPDANAGKSYVVFGSSLGFNSTFELSSLNGSNGFIINGINPDEESGFSVSGGGDINGDGVKDLIIGAPESDANGTLTGESYVVFGSSSFSQSLDLSTLNGSNGFVINGIDDGDRSGRSVS